MSERYANALITKLKIIKKHENTNDTKNIHAFGNTDITGRAIFEAQPSNVNTCSNVNIACDKFENSINTPPYKYTEIIENT